MSDIKLEPNSSGSGTFAIKSPDSNNNRQFILPTESGTLFTDSAFQSLNSTIPYENLPVGTILQVQRVRFDDRVNISAPNNTAGTDVTQLAVSITPRQSSSLMMCRWFIQGESTGHDIGWRVRVDGSEPSDGYNTDAGNERWSFLTSAQYDGNNDSTPRLETLNYFHKPNTTDEVVYSPSVSSSNSNNRTFRMNRTDGSTGQDSFEVGVSWGVVYEIAQI